MIWFFMFLLFSSPRKTLKESMIAESTQMSFREGDRVFTFVAYRDVTFLREINFLTGRDSFSRLKAR